MIQMFEALVLVAVVFGGLFVLGVIADVVVPAVDKFVNARIGAVVAQADEK